MTSVSVTSPPEVALRDALVAAGNPGGGWAYYSGKSSRLEPTAWALIAAGVQGASTPNDRVHAQFLTGCQGPSGWLVENPRWPVNIGYNAAVAICWLAQPRWSTPEATRRSLAALVSSRGIKVPQMEGQAQDNSLQAWSWIDGTFSWVEPTAFALIALKKARRMGMLDAPGGDRIAEAEELLVDRACRPGGWNFGNSNVMRQDLRPYVPTTALGLLAMQDRADDPVVRRGVDFLEGHWADEISAPALGLSVLALRAHRRSTTAVESRLREHAHAAIEFGNWHGVAIALAALSKGPVGESLNAFAY